MHSGKQESSPFSRKRTKKLLLRRLPRGLPPFCQSIRLQSQPACRAGVGIKVFWSFFSKKDCFLAFPYPCYRPHVLHRLAAWSLGLYLDLTLRSTRWTVEGAAHLAPYLPGGAVIIAVWHERLPMIPALWTPSRRQNPTRGVAALASRHKDGRLIAGVMARFGVRAIHGSTAHRKPGSTRSRNTGGAAALRGLIAALAAGDAVVITPDGPRGPARVAAPGVAQLSAITGAPVIAVAGAVRHRLILRSWDRLMLPLPFGRGVLVCAPEIRADDAAEDAALARIAASLTEAADRADMLCLG